MPGYLRQATASQSRAIGPFISDSDFKTVQTGLTIANTDVKLVINGAASANKNSGGGTHRVNGVYGFTFDATDTATIGEMEVSILVSGALVVFDKFFVITAQLYDLLTTDGTGVTINLKQLSVVNSGGSAIVASSTGSNGHGIAASGNGSGEGLSATGGATGHGIEAIGGATSGNGITATAATSGHGLIATGANAGTGLRGIGGTSGAGLYCEGGATNGTGAVFTASGGNAHGLAVTGEGTGSGFRASANGTGHGVSATGGSTSGNGITATATNGNGHGIIATGQGSGEGLKGVGGATGNGIEGVGGGTSGDGINANAAVGLDINAPNSDIGGVALSAAGLTAVEDEIWDAVLADHLDAGSTGEGLSDAGGAGTPPTVGEIADAVWDEATAGHTTGGTFGAQAKTVLDTKASQTSVDDLPTNAELTTALGTADDAVLAAIAALNNLSAAQVWAAGTRTLTAIDEDSTTLDLDATIRAAVGMASANLDTQLGDLPTNAELATALGTADDAVLAAIAALNNLSAAQVTAAVPTAVQNADALLKRDWTLVTGESARSALNALRFLRNKWSIAGGVLDVLKEDDSTSAWTGAVTQTAGDPVSEIDPA